jgi:agmatinase
MSESRFSDLEFPPFLSSEFPPAAGAEEADFHFIPFPLERTVSYGGGTVKGPGAILQASLQLEAWDEEENALLPGSRGFFTHPAIDCSAANGAPGEDAPTQAALDAAGRLVADLVEAGKFPLLFGGEHTVTGGPIAELARRGREFGIVQIDAHADLRDTYEGSKLSHACVMRRAAELGVPLFQIGVRALCQEEAEYRAAHPDRLWWLDAHELEQRPPTLLLPREFPAEIYVTVDVDGLDPAIMPSTGTPVPGGLGWFQALAYLRKVALERRVIAADIVELAPIDGMHHADFLTAKLAAKMLGLFPR